MRFVLPQRAIAHRSSLIGLSVLVFLLLAHGLVRTHHLATHQHVYCAEHAEIEHSSAGDGDDHCVHSTEGESQHRDRHHSADHADDPHDNEAPHERCDALELFQVDQMGADAPTLVSEARTNVVLEQPAVHPIVSSRGVFRLAPKQSPPSVVLG